MKYVIQKGLFIIQLQQSLESNAESPPSGVEQNKSPGVVHDVLHYLVQDFLEESRPDPDVFDGLGREGLRGAAGSGGALSPQRFVAHALGPPAGEQRTHVIEHRDREELKFVSETMWTQRLKCNNQNKSGTTY